MKILVLQNHANSGLGYLEEPAAQHGAAVTVCQPNVIETDRIPAGHAGYDGFVLMGGAMNAGEVDKHPWLEDAAHLVQRFNEAEKPVLGICLGSQIIARASGARVYDLPRPEVGFVSLSLTDTAAGDPLLGQGFANPITLAEFHGQTFDIPSGATQLMAGAVCANQAFRIGAATYAFQPHFEVTPEMMTHWVSISEEMVPKHEPDLPERLPHLLKLHHYGSHDFCYRVGSAWFELVAARMAQG